LLKDGADGIKIGPFGSALKLEDMVDSGIRVYGQENVIQRSFSLGKRRISSNKFDEMRVYQVCENDLLITMMGTSGKCELVPAEAEVGIIDSHLLRLRVREAEILPRFFRLLIDECYEVENQIKVSGKGSIMHGLNSSIVKALELPLPSVPEQNLILNFLDHETTKIDTLIEKQQQLIKLLKEKRQAVISHAVTKGLNPNAPMRDSGVEWLGEVPEHWSTGKLGYYSKISNGATPARDNIAFWENGSVGWLNSSKVNDIMIYQADQFITPLAVSQTSVQPVKENDLLMAITGEGQTRGRIAICKTDATINQHLASISIIDPALNYQYLFYWLTSQYGRIRFESSGAGSTKGAITCSDITSYPLPVPPLKEQGGIVLLLLEAETKLNHLIQLSIDQIVLLQERRTALISAAVTGKIDVRNV